MLASFQLLAQVQGRERPMERPTFYRRIQLDRLSIFYREAGPKNALTVLVLQWTCVFRPMFEDLFPGFPTVITLSRPITGASDTAADLIRTFERGSEYVRQENSNHYGTLLDHKRDQEITQPGGSHEHHRSPY
jgi:hypothetical protein